MMQHLPIARPEELDPGVYEIGRDFILVAGGKVTDTAGYIMFENGGQTAYIVLAPNNANNEFTIPLPAPVDIKSGGTQLYKYDSSYLFKQVNHSFSTPASFKTWAQSKVGTGGASKQITESYSSF